jgi:hypothetical protein
MLNTKKAGHLLGEEYFKLNKGLEAYNLGHFPYTILLHDRVPFTFVISVAALESCALRRSKPVVGSSMQI